jgi:DNA-binding SARP family transcriptional activator
MERLLRRVESADTPLVHVWGWPGSGKAVLLGALLERKGRSALGLPLAAFDGEKSVREAIELAAAAGAAWLVASGEPSEAALAAAERLLLPGQRLVFAGSSRRRGTALSRTVIPPQELLLSAAELANLWNLLTGVELDPETAEALRQASDGWYRPLRLALEATGGFGLEGAGPEQILEIPPVLFFLREEVLGLLAAEDSDLLLTTPAERPAGLAEDGWALIEERGLWVEGERGDRLPRLLAAALDRKRRRQGLRPPPSRAPERPAAAMEAAAEARPVYKLGLLGTPLARLRDAEGERDLDCRLRRSYQVLAYLASSPGMEAGREELIDAVWPTEGERTIERNFHPTLSHLRRALEGGRKGGPSPLLLRAGGYRLNPEVAWEIDVIELARRFEEGKEALRRDDVQAAVETWSAAWKLYRGPFLQGHYESWVTARREQYQRLYLDLLRKLGDQYVALERLEEAMDAYRSVLLEDPLQERVHVAVMRIFAAQGRRDLVRRQYDRLCATLTEELGVTPAQETTEEYHLLMG